MSLLAATSASKVSCFLCFLMFSTLKDTSSLDEAYARLVWSFNALWEGRHPTHDWRTPPQRMKGDQAFQCGVYAIKSFAACMWLSSVLSCGVVLGLCI